MKNSKNRPVAGLMVVALTAFVNAPLAVQAASQPGPVGPVNGTHGMATLVAPIGNQQGAQFRTTIPQGVLTGLTGNAPAQPQTINVATSNLFTHQGAHTLIINSPIDFNGSLIIPRGYTVLEKTGTALQLSGSLTNNGKLLFVGPQGDTAGITAGNIVNGKSALISSQMSGQTLGLNLNATNDIANYGTISSSSYLNMTAGGTISNVGNAAFIGAPGHISLVSGTGQFTNSGTISSSAGNVNFAASSPATNIDINNIGGTISALNSAINVRDAAYAGAANINIVGGDLLSKTLNLYSGLGTANTSVGQLTGLVNVFAENAHIGASTKDLQFGNLCTTGDPTYYNTAGNISLASIPNSAGADIAILAWGDITVTGDITTTNAAGGKGGTVTLIAGASLTATPADSGNNGTDPNSGTLVTVNTFTHSLNGGSISMPTSNITTTGTAAGGVTDANGGNVTLVALSGNPSKGKIDGPLSITTGGVGTGTNGDVVIVAGTTLGTGINVGNISTSTTHNGSSTNGGVSILGGAPMVDNGVYTVLNGTVQPGSGNWTVAFGQASTITVGNVTATGSPFRLTTGSDDSAVTLGTMPSNTSSFRIDAGSLTLSHFTNNAAITSGSVALNGTTINIDKSITATTGSISVRAPT